MKNFKLIFMSFDGDYVTDSEHNNLEDAETAWSNIGSKWFFYPFGFIISGKTVKETGEGLVNMKTKEAYMPKMFQGKRLQTVVKEFEKANDYCVKEGIECDCYGFEEILIAQILHV